MCWVCESTRTTPHKPRNLEGPLGSLDLRITDARYGTTLALRLCSECGFLFADDPDLDALTGLYAALDDPDYASGEESRSLQMRWLLDLCERAEPGASTLLDVGAATGLLVREAARRGLDAVGVEPSARLAETARAGGAEVLEGTLPHPALAGRGFDLVTVVDVIEHVRDPVGLLRASAATLAPGGLLVVVTPDVGSVAARLLGPRWWHFRVAHVGYFSGRSFTRAAERAGLRVEAHHRARWFFPARYLIDRLERYLPVRNLAGKVARVPGGRALLDRILPVNLFDSSVFLLRRATERP